MAIGGEVGWLTVVLADRTIEEDGEGWWSTGRTALQWLLSHEWTLDSMGKASLVRERHRK